MQITLEDCLIGPDDGFIGQSRLCETLGIHICSALNTGQPLPHVLLTAPPGAGKSTLAKMVAHKMGQDLAILTLPVKAKHLMSFFRQLETDIILLDEVHRASKMQQEDFLNLLEDGFFQSDSGRRIEMPDLTVIAATTEPDKLTTAFYDRFVIKPVFEPYSHEDMKEIVLEMAVDRAVDLELSDEIASTIASAAVGVPRNARHMVDAAEALVNSGRELTPATLLGLCRLDPTGLSQTQLDYIDALRKLGGQAGLELLATFLRLHPSVVKDAERLLVERDFLMYSERGRELTQKGWAYGKVEQERRVS